jgi:hypothetical protein
MNCSSDRSIGEGISYTIWNQKGERGEIGSRTLAMKEILRTDEAFLLQSRDATRHQKRQVHGSSPVE